MCHVVDFIKGREIEVVELLMFFVTSFFIKYLNISGGQEVCIWIWYGFSLISYWYRIYTFLHKRRLY